MTAKELGDVVFCVEERKPGYVLALAMSVMDLISEVSFLW